MSAALISLLSALAGIAIKSVEARERLKAAALAAGEITVEELTEQDRLLGEVVGRLKGMVGL